MDRRSAEESIRFAFAVVSDPGQAVSRWKAVSGWKAAGCSPRFPAPEVLHAVELLPVPMRSAGQPPAARMPFDAWVFDPAAGRGAAGQTAGPVHLFPDRIAAAPEDALEQVEALAEWAESITGRRCTEGALDKSLRAYGERDAWLRALATRCETEPRFLGRRQFETIVGAGAFLPVQSHTRLLKRLLQGDAPRAAPETGGGDPFVAVALRAAGRPPDRTA